MIKLSATGKMPCRSWSLQALTTCPASKAKDGGLVDACKGCYATTGNYRFPNVKAPRLSNQIDWKREEWTHEMIELLDNDRYFRWFDSGDLYDIRLARKVLEIMKATPHCTHWLPTRMHKFPKFQAVLAEMSALSNVVIRLSSDSVTGEIVEPIAGVDTSSTIIPTIDDIVPTMALCEASTREGKCGPCRQCWSKDIKVIAYPAHGVSMKKVIRLIQL